MNENRQIYIFTVLITEMQIKYFMMQYIIIIVTMNNNETNNYNKNIPLPLENNK